MRRATARRQATSDAACLLAPVPLVWTARPSHIAKLFGRSNARSHSPEAELPEKILHALMDRTRGPPCSLGRVDVLLFSTVCHCGCAHPCCVPPDKLRLLLSWAAALQPDRRGRRLRASCSSAGLGSLSRSERRKCVRSIEAEGCAATTTRRHRRRRARRRRTPQREDDRQQQQ